MAMRITEAITYANFLKNIQDLNRKYYKYNEQVSTGKRINRPSDDPVDFTKIISLKNELGDKNQFIENISTALRRLEASDSRLNDVSLEFTRLIQLNEQAANETTVGEPRKGIAQEVYSLTQEMLNNADANFNGRALFAGTRNTIDTLGLINNNPGENVYSVGAYSTTLDGAASANWGVTINNANNLTQRIYQVEITALNGTDVDYEIRDLDGNSTVASGTAAVGDTITVDGLNFTYAGGAAVDDVYTAVPVYAYNGTSDDIEMQVGENTRIVQNIQGPRPFGGTEPTGAIQNPGGTVFDDMVEFRRALLTDDQDAILTSLDTMYDDHDNINRVRAESGGRISNLRSLLARTENETAELITQLADIEGANLPEAISKLVQTEGGRQAALQAGARISRVNLFDIIG